MVLNPKRSPPVKKALIKYIKARDNYRKELGAYIIRNSKPVGVQNDHLTRSNMLIYSYDDKYVGTVYVSKTKYYSAKKYGVKASFIKVK